LVIVNGLVLQFYITLQKSLVSPLVGTKHIIIINNYTMDKSKDTKAVPWYAWWQIIWYKTCYKINHFLNGAVTMWNCTHEFDAIFTRFYWQHTGCINYFLLKFMPPNSFFVNFLVYWLLTEHIFKDFIENFYL